jgi:hypothetical protein
MVVGVERELVMAVCNCASLATQKTAFAANAAPEGANRQGNNASHVPP